MIYIGTSGWNYGHWNGSFYPKGLASREQLPFMARHFPTVELNASFYRLPPESSFRKWHNDTPDDFRFSVKVPRVISHLKRLHDVADDWQQTLTAAQPLKDKISVYLCQFPPSFKVSNVSVERLEAFLNLVNASNVRMAFELRHSSWFESDALALFEQHKACVVQADSSRFPHTPEGFAPAAFAYYRFHGPRELYASQYTDEELLHWAVLIRMDIKAGRDVYVYFDNDGSGYALRDAKRLQALLSS